VVVRGPVLGALLAAALALVACGGGAARSQGLPMVDPEAGEAVGGRDLDTGEEESLEERDLGDGADDEPLGAADGREHGEGSEPTGAEDSRDHPDE